MVDILEFTENEESINVKFIDHKVSTSNKQDYLQKQLSIYYICLKPLLDAMKEQFKKEVKVELIGHQINKKTGKEKRIDIEYMGDKKTKEFIDTA
tara:strand:+ start:498 stop:782 length:285 start_codon:yes stop_codon:yes gene_type:complete